MSAFPSLSVWVQGIGLLAPGWANWPQAQRTLTGQEAYQAAATVLPAPDQLPPAERRRASRVIKLVMAIAAEACRAAQRDPATLASVFASSTGDGHNCHAICEVLAGTERDVSPTRFHNSVHNTAAGYWCIAVHAMGPCQVLAAYDASFAAGLLEAAVQVAAEQRDVLLVAYDADYPEPLLAARPVPDAAGVAMMLCARQPAGASVRLDLRWLPPAHSATDTTGVTGVTGVTGAPAGASADRTDATPMPDAALERLRTAIPAMRALPLLRVIASGQAGEVILPAQPGQGLLVQVTPCS